MLEHSAGHDRACAMHDATAVVFVVERDAFEVTSGPARVICDGIAVGQLALDRKGEPYVLPYWENRPDTHAAMKVDVERVRGAFLDTIIKHAVV